MATARTTGKILTSQSALDTYITGLQNAHALEEQVCAHSRH